MSIRCETARERLAAIAGAPRPWAAELEAHLEACGGCRRWSERLAEALGALARLPRLEAPSELETRVRAELAALGAGGRVVSRLERLRRLAAPAELDGRAVAAMHAGFHEDRAIEHVLALPRLAAPSELDRAVERALAQTETPASGGSLGREEPGSAGLRRGLRRVRATAWLAAGTLVAFVLGWGLGSLPSADEAGPPGLARGVEPIPSNPVDFEVIYRSEPSAPHAPMGQGLLASLSGGLSEVVGAPSAAPPDASSGSRREPLPAPPPTEASEPIRQGPGAESPTLELGTTQPLLERIAEAPAQIGYTGRRLVRLADPLGSGAALVLRERVSSDGRGRFAIDPLEVVSAPADSFAYTSFFAGMQKAREGFIFRFRDFQIRDLDRFLVHYRTRVIADRVLVADRPCVLLDVRRIEGAERYYEVAVDLETGLVLRYRELVATTGELLTSVEFERLELRPTIDPEALSSGRSFWREIDAAAAEPTDAGFPLHQPSFVPSGYAFERASTRDDGLGRTWIQFVFGDGAEELFFLHSGPTSPHGDSSPVGGRVEVTRIGAWTVVEGEVAGTPIIAMGKIAAEDLLLFVQSAFR